MLGGHSAAAFLVKSTSAGGSSRDSFLALGATRPRHRADGLERVIRQRARRPRVRRRRLRSTRLFQYGGPRAGTRGGTSVGSPSARRKRAYPSCSAAFCAYEKQRYLVRELLARLADTSRHRAASLENAEAHEPQGTSGALLCDLGTSASASPLEGVIPILMRTPLAVCT